MAKKKVIDSKIFKQKFATSRFKSSKKLEEIVEAIANGDDFASKLEGLNDSEKSFLFTLKSISSIVIDDSKPNKKEVVEEVKKTSTKKTSSKTKKNDEEKKSEVLEKEKEEEKVEELNKDDSSK